MRILIVVLTLLIFQFNAFSQTACKISKPEKESLVKSDYKEFDQTMSKGWRTWADQGCYEIAIELLDEYYKAHESNLLDWQKNIIIWHSGQMSAFLGNYKKAKENFKKCINPNEPKDIEILWNDYVYATIAFLDKDLAELKKRRDIIAAGPSMEGKKANLNIVENFLKCPNETYSIAYSGCNSTASQKLTISLQSNNDAERKAKQLIEELVTKYDLSRFYFTDKIHIQSFAIPHSHPLLTLNTRTINEPDRYLSLFLHEQIHWFLESAQRNDKTKIFIEKMKKKFPKIPSQKEGGARTDESTYLHLGVCFYEFEELSKLIGHDKATQIFQTDKIYTWVREQVLANRESIQIALKDSGLTWEYAKPK